MSHLSISRPLRWSAPLLLGLLGACASVPELGPRPQPRDAATIAAAQSLPGAAAVQWPADAWWTAYGDPQLDGLIDEGLRNSPDVAAAAARFRRAGGFVQEAGAARLPQIDANGAVTIDKQSYNNGFPREFLPQGWNDRGQAAVSLDFDLDLWGRNRAALAAATSEERAAAIDTQQARLLLSTGIASAYADLARLHAVRDVRQAELAVRSNTQQLIAQRLANGLETRGSLRQGEADAATARGAVAAADEAIGLRRNQLAALLGAGPDRGLAIARPSFTAVPLRPLPQDVTTALIGRRPDIAAARDRVEAAASRIKVARADFYPAVRLSALVGLQSLGLDMLTNTGSIYGSAGPAFSLPIFRGGQLQGRYRGARANYDEAVADYDRSVVDGYRQVADAVTSQRAMELRLNAARAALVAAQDAYGIARQRYTAGLSNYIDVLVIEDRLLTARLALAGLEADARSLDIALIRALGGGFDTPPAPAAPSNSSDKDLPNG